MKAATKAEDALIVAIGCRKFCFQGYVGGDNCNLCGGTGSQLKVVVNGSVFPNTKAGYDDALAELRRQR